ncbi:hypothetical protein RCOM_0661850 [Ricinus communis]|uniref:RNase H type-1 domain-containing protein n=1 Tax=Ricinus communis TaxID=3988 RepID=B9STE1_RICCO|nr:hypothetical protein RCOM_0661850 [Ricinus communis]
MKYYEEIMDAQEYEKCLSSNISNTDKVCRWISPDKSEVKLNTDGAYVDLGRGMVVGGVLRNCRRGWLMGFKNYIGSCSPLDVELWGALLGLNMAYAVMVIGRDWVVHCLYIGQEANDCAHVMDKATLDGDLVSLSVCILQTSCWFI